MLNLDDFQALQRRVERLRQERDEVRGMIAAARERLAKEFSCPDPEAARARLAKLEKKERRLAEEYTAAKKEFEDRFAERLRGT